MAEEEIVEAYEAADRELCFGGCTSQEIFAAGWKAARPLILEEAAKACEQQQRAFLSERYATGQPLSSFQERFACGLCAQAIRGMVDGR